MSLPKTDVGSCNKIDLMSDGEDVTPDTEAGCIRKNPSLRSQERPGLCPVL